MKRRSYFAALASSAGASLLLGLAVGPVDVAAADRRADDAARPTSNDYHADYHADYNTNRADRYDPNRTDRYDRRNTDSQRDRSRDSRTAPADSSMNPTDVDRFNRDRFIRDSGRR